MSQPLDNVEETMKLQSKIEEKEVHKERQLKEAESDQLKVREAQHHQKLKTSDDGTLSHVIQSNTQEIVTSQVRSEISIMSLQIKLHKLQQQVKAEKMDIQMINDTCATKTEQLNQELADRVKVEREYKNTAIMINKIKEHYSNISSEYNAVRLQKSQLADELSEKMRRFRATQNSFQSKAAELKTTNQKLTAEINEKQTAFDAAKDVARQKMLEQQQQICALRKNKEEREEKWRDNERQVVQMRERLQEKREHIQLMQAKIAILDNNLIADENVRQARLSNLEELKQRISDKKTAIEEKEHTKQVLLQNVEAEIHKTMALEQQLVSVKEAVTAKQEEKNIIEADINQQRSDIEECNAIMLPKLENLKATVEDLEARNSKSIAEDTTNIMKSLQNEKMRHQSLLIEKASMDAEVCALRQQLAERQEVIVKTNDENATLKNVFNELKNKLAELQKKGEADEIENDAHLKTLREEINVKREQQQTLEKAFKIRIEALNAETVERRLKFAGEVTNRHVKHTEQLAKLRNDVSKVNEEIKGQVRRRNALTNKRASMQEELEKQKRKIDELEEQKVKLKQEIEQARPTGILKNTDRAPSQIGTSDSQELSKHVSFQHNLRWESSESGVDEPVSTSLQN